MVSSPLNICEVVMSFLQSAPSQKGDRGGTVVKVLCYKSEGRWFYPSFASACKTNTTQNQPHQISNTQRTENKTTDVVIQQHSRNLLMMDILMSET